MTPAETIASAIRSPESTTNQVASPLPIRRTSGWPSRLITLLLLLAGAAVLVGGIGFRLAGLHLSPVLSNSMQPAFSAGDLVIARPVPVASLVVGDVIVFVPPGHNQAVAHRIAAINAGSITSRGDANPVGDPWQVQLSGPTVEHVVATVPYLGWSSQLERPLLAMAALVVGAVLLFELWKEVGKRFKRT